MKIIKTIKELREELNIHKKNGKTVGLVPTMGALHDGHCKLIERSVSENDLTVVSIFVNPTQFGPNEDFNKYPRTLEEDCRKSESYNADIIFNPDASEIYKSDSCTFVDIEKLQNNLCGLKRPGHFKGVCTIVSKLFNIVMPDNAYFGKKDIQQLTIIEQMTRDLNFPINIVPCEIIREKDGLAMSSRNKYLSDKERGEALILFNSLNEAAELITQGENSSQKIINMIKDKISRVENAEVDYVSIVNRSMEDTASIKTGDIIALAVFIGSTRLIDNHIIGEPLCL